jgi:protein-S-isoprenylcysteine O-methyltransferase Ste14
MHRLFFFVFGVLSHLMFLAVFAYMLGFVANVGVPKSIDGPAVAGGSTAAAIAVNLLLLAAFTVPHSVMARPGFKRWWTTIVPTPIERSVYVYIANLFMIALLMFWEPMPAVLWDIEQPAARTAIWILFAAGWLLVPLASLMINHFDLFGTRQVWLYLRQKAYTSLPFRTPWLYRYIRHPLYVGWITAFWATPTMTAGHLLFAATMTAYMLIAIPLEERDLKAHFGKEYIAYKQRTGGLIPRIPPCPAGAEPVVDPA